MHRLEQSLQNTDRLPDRIYSLIRASALDIMAQQNPRFLGSGERTLLRRGGETRNYEKYVYQPLNTARMIRLLRKTPSQSGLAIPQFTIEHHSIDEPYLQYEAVSYCWGSPDQTATLMLTKDDGSGRLLPVTHSAREVACAVGQSGNLFWIDQVCIDQSKDAEKGHSDSAHGRYIQQMYQMHRMTGIGRCKQ